jgi:hypothetical protein
MLLRRLAASTSAGVVGSVTQSSALTGSATTSQSSTSGPLSAPSPGTYPWYLDSRASFHMNPHSAHLSSMRPFYRHLTVQAADGSPLSVVGQSTLCFDSFYIPDVSLVPDLTMQLRALFGIASKQLPLELSGARPQMARFSHRFSPPRFLSKLS